MMEKSGIKNNEEKIIHILRHFMWSKFYFYKKKYNFYIAFIYFIPILIRLFLRIFFHTLSNDKKKINKYKARLSGLVNSILGKSSSYRIG